MLNLNNDPEYRRGWKLDKQISIALIVSMLIQSSAVVWWAARIESRVETLELHDSNNTLLLDRVTRVEERIISLKETTLQFDQKLEEALTRKR